jgi:signal transduction histidine kinase
MTDEVHRLRTRLERERQARREAEEVAERTLLTLSERQRELELLQAVADAANEATAIEPALGAAIVHVCAHMRWPVGHAYLADVATDALRPTGIWYLEHVDRFEAFRVASEHLTRERGLPGRVLDAGEPAWVADVASEPAFLRGEVAVAAGLRSGFAFPILTGARAVGVLEFFTDRPAEPDPALLRVMAQIGVQLGRVIERVRARQELERSNAELEAFAYVASHDLSEPLRSVTGFVSLLGRRYGDALDDTARELIAYAADGATRMQAMIDDLLLYARAGTAELADDEVDAGAAVAGALRSLEDAIAARGATVEVGELPRVRADLGQLERVFQNLLANAVKYTERDVTPRVTVSARPEEACWEIAVADNGVGVDPAQADRVFESFARLPGGAAQADGTGLGLAICRRIVERHGGRIWVEPGADGGSVFRLTLPRA